MYRLENLRNKHVKQPALTILQSLKHKGTLKYILIKKIPNSMRILILIKCRLEHFLCYPNGGNLILA